MRLKSISLNKYDDSFDRTAPILRCFTSFLIISLAVSLFQLSLVNATPASCRKIYKPELALSLQINPLHPDEKPLIWHESVNDRYLYDSIRPRLEKSIDLKSLKTILSEIPNWRNIDKFRGAWLPWRKQMRKTDLQSIEAQGFWNIQKIRTNSSNTIKGSQSETAFVDWLAADDLVIDWIERGEPIRIDHLQTLNRVADKNRGSMLPPSMGPFAAFNPFLRMIETNMVGRPGEFRNSPVYSIKSDSSERDPRNAFIDPRDIPRALRDFFEWYHLNEGSTHPAVLAAISYRWIVSIHPFGNGNGRTARLVMDWILQKNGYPPSAIAPGEHAAASFGRHSPESEESQSVTQEAIVAAVIKGVHVSANLMVNSPKTDGAHK